MSENGYENSLSFLFVCLFFFTKLCLVCMHLIKLDHNKTFFSQMFKNFEIRKIKRLSCLHVSYQTRKFWRKLFFFFAKFACHFGSNVKKMMTKIYIYFFFVEFYLSCTFLIKLEHLEIFFRKKNWLTTVLSGNIKLLLD